MTLVNLSNQIVMVAEEGDYKTTEDHMVEYIESLQALEEAMEPYKEQKRELRKEYEENKWLSKEEMRMAVKAYRLMKSDTDFDQLTEYFNRLKRTFLGNSNA